MRLSVLNVAKRPIGAPLRQDTMRLVSALAAKGFMDKGFINKPFINKIGRQPNKPNTFRALKKALLVTARSMAACTVCLSIAQAKLPAPIENALVQAHIPATNVSMIIMPVKQLTYTGNQSSSSISYSSPDAVSILSNFLPEEDAVTTDADHQQPLMHTPKRQSTDRPSSGLLVRHFPNVLRTPASVMKLVPTFIALDVLGPEFRWVTNIYHTGIVINHTLYGDLIIQGSGDPKLTHKHLAIVLARVKQHGIYRIHGDIVLDTSIFQDVTKDPADFDDQASRPYNVSPDGLLINFNSLEINAVVPSNASAAKLFYRPKLADFSLPKQLPLRQANCDSIAASLAPSWQQTALTFHNKFPNACNLHTFYLAYPNGKDFAKRAIKQQWLDLDATLSGHVVSTEHPRLNRFDNYLTQNTSIDTPPTPWPMLQTLAASPLPMVTYASAPLSQQLYDINHYSNNVMTEQLLLSLAAYKKPVNTGLDVEHHANLANKPDTDKAANQSGKLPPSSSLAHTDAWQLTEGRRQAQTANYPKAFALVNQWWQTHLTSKPPYLTNGSGLCRDCSVTADSIAELLEHAYHHPDFYTYLNSLGVAGISGTVQNHAQRLPHSAAIGHAWIKTGTLDNAAAMAGYVHSDSGQDYIVVGLINDPNHLNTSGARHALDIMLDWTARQ